VVLKSDANLNPFNFEERKHVKQPMTTIVSRTLSCAGVDTNIYHSSIFIVVVLSVNGS